jgi:hypothetical protein
MFVVEVGFTTLPLDYYKSSPLWFVVGGTKALVLLSKMNTRIYVIRVTGA